MEVIEEPVVVPPAKDISKVDDLFVTNATLSTNSSWLVVIKSNSIFSCLPASLGSAMA